MTVSKTLLTCLLLSSLRIFADQPDTIVVGHARFEVITPNLIRIEYAPDDKFVDAPS